MMAQANTALLAENTGQTPVPPHPVGFELGDVLRIVSERRKIILGVALLTFAATAWVFYTIPKGFFPQQDTGQISGGLRADQSISFQAMQEKLGASFDRFIRTTDEDHYAASQAIWEKMEANGDIYLSKYEGWYSVRDEAYYVEDETVVKDDGTWSDLITESEERIGGMKTTAR